MSQTQMIIVYPLFLIILCLNLFKGRIYYLLIFLALIISSVLFYSQHSLLLHSRTDLLVKQFSDDRLGQESQIFNDLLKKELGNFELVKIKQVQQDYDVTSADLTVVSGNQNWLKVERPKSRIKSLLNYSLTQKIGLDIQYHANLSSYGMSLQPASETAIFLLNLTNAEASPLHEAEVFTRYAASFKSVWNSNTHLAYARFLLALNLFEQLISSTYYQPGLHQCFKKEFRKAISLLESEKNPELLVMINNMLGVNAVIESFFTKKNKLKLASKYFKEAYRTDGFARQNPGFYSQSLTARSNFLMLRNYFRKRP